jgi:phage FluMu protein Com
MAIAFHCTHCNHALRVPDDVAGKRIKCPKCQQVLRIPETAGQPAEEPSPTGSQPEDAQPLLQLKTPDGSVYGPVTRSEMDGWLHEGRVTADCELLDERGNHWRWAGEVYRQLQTAATPPPPPPSGIEPVKPVTVHPVAPGLAPPASAAAEPWAPSGEPNVRHSHAATEPVAPRFRPRSYPAMLLTSRFYRAIGWVLIFVGGIGAFFSGVILIGGPVMTGQLGEAGLVSIMLGLAGLVVGAIVIATWVITFWFAAEAIRCLIDIEDNSHRCAFYLQDLQRREQDESPSAKQ